MDRPPLTHLLYLHGFRSSPQSAKAQIMARHVSAHHPLVHWWCPQLPPSPREAMELIMDGISHWPRPRMGVVGSSLGGYYATYVTAMTHCRAVLLNPAVHPARDLARHIGEHPVWQRPQDRVHFRAEYIAELDALEVGPLSRPEQALVVMAQGDEVLDWREMAARYPHSPTELRPGGDHGLSDFASAHLPQVLAFLELA